jgi:hypothetical protein
MKKAHKMQLEKTRMRKDGRSNIKLNGSQAKIKIYLKYLLIHLFPFI